MPIVIEEEGEPSVQALPGGLRVPGPTPPSLQGEAQALFTEARDELKRDFPGIEFGVRGKDFTIGTGAEPAPISDEEDFQLGVIEPAPPAPAAEVKEPEGNTYWMDVFTQWGAFGKSVKTGSRRMAFDEMDFQFSHNAKRAEVITPELVQRARTEGINLMDTPEVQEAAKSLGMRTDTFLRDPYFYLNMSPDDRQKYILKNQGKASAARDTATEAADEAKIAATMRELYRPEYKTLGNWDPRALAFDALASAPYLGTAVAVSIPLGPGAGAASLFATTLPDSYNEGRDIGLPRAQAQAYAGMMALAEAVPETKVLEKLATPSLKRTIRDSLLKSKGKRAVEIGTAEAISEIVTSGLQDAARAGVFDQNITVPDALRNMARSGAVGFLAGAGIGAVTPSGRAPDTLPAPEGAAPQQPPAASAGPAPAPTPAARPIAAPAQSVAAAPGMVAPGRVTMYQPEGATGATPVIVKSISGNIATVTSLDENGEELIVDGEPATYQAQLSDLGRRVAPATQVPAQRVAATTQPVATAAVQPAVPSAAPPVQAAAVSPVPDVPTAEPMLDLEAQRKELFRQGSPRLGLYLSPDNVAQMTEAGTLEKFTRAGVVLPNFDSKGGVLITRNKKVADEARAARDAGQTDMQAILGALTGAGVGKKPGATVVVQQRTPEGAVVRESVVPPAEVQATAQQMAEPGKTVVAVPAAEALARRDQLIAQETAPAAQPAAPKVKGTALDQISSMMEFVQERERVPAGRKFASSLEDRQLTVSQLATVVGDATKEAAKRGAPDEVVARANKAVREAIGFKDKTEFETRKGRGTSHERITRRVAELMEVAESLRPFAAQPVTTGKAKTGAAEEAKEGPAEKAKQVSRERARVTSDTEEDVAARQARVNKVFEKLKGGTAKPVINVVPRAASGQEMLALVKELGLDAEKLSEAGRGALANELRRLLPDFNRSGSWTQYIASLRTSRTLKPSQMQGLLRLVQAYGVADDNQLTKARDAIISYLQDLDGSTLDPKAIEAVVEYAKFRKSFASVRERIEGISAEDVGETVEEPEHTVEGEIDEDINDFERAQDSYSSIIDEAVSMDLLDTWRPVFNAFMANDFHATLVAKYKGKSNFIGAHQFLATLLGNMRMAGVRDTYQVALLEKLLATVPDVPILIADEIINLQSGVREAGTGGQFNPRTNLIQVTLREKPTVFDVRTVLHEIIHAATSYEIRGDQTTPLYQEIKNLVIEARKLAAKKYGADVIRAHLAYFQNPAAQAKPDNYNRNLYGLTNPEEMVAEVFTNTAFQAELLDWGRAYTGQSRTILHKIIRAIADFLGIKNPRQRVLLENIMGVGIDIMEAQKAGARGYDETFKRVREHLKREHPTTSDANLNRMAHKTTRGLGVAPYGLKTEDMVAAILADSPIMDEGRVLPLANARSELRALEVIMKRDPEAAYRSLAEEETLRAVTSDTVVAVAKATRNFAKSRAFDVLQKSFLALYSFDQIERRMSRFFGAPQDPLNPLTSFMDVRRKRISRANDLLERAERDVNGKWLQLNSKENTELGQLMIDTTLWQIDPSKPKDKQPARATRRKDFDKRFAEFKARWRQLNDKQREVYEAARDYNEFLFGKIRRAAIDLALTGLTDKDLSKAERSMLYAIRNPDDVDEILGDGKLIDLGEHNERFGAAVRDLLKITTVQGPYFTLRRHGNKVVQAEKEGTNTFSSMEEAEAFAEEVKDMTPKNKAKIVQREGKIAVDYKMEYVSFHKSKAEAEADAERMRARGFQVGPVTEKTTSTTPGVLSAGLKELLSGATRKLEQYGSSEGTGAMKAALETAFMQILAERAAISSQLRREGVAGVKPDEMHIGFAERAHSSSWHYANLVTAIDETRTLTRLRQYARDPEMGLADQSTMYERGQTVLEVEKRMAREVQDFGIQNPASQVLAKVGFTTFLATPSYAFVNATQNFTVAIPTIAARFGYGRTSRAFARAMRVVAGPAFGKAFRGMARKPGAVNTYDIYTAVAQAVEADPRMKKWLPQIKELVDLGVINATFTQEINAVANNDWKPVRKAMEYMRLLPQGAELFNRVSTSLAVLELTNGNVAKTADLVRLTQIDYNWANQPRAFKYLGRTLTMFKMYPQAIYNLLISSVYDAITGAGGSRAEAAKTFGGLVVSHTLAAGVIGGLLMEPVRLLMWAINAAFGDEDEPYDLDTSVRNFMADTFGDFWGGVASRGLPNALGIDLSTRMGLNHLAFFNPPDFTAADEGELWKSIGEFLGPIPSYAVRGSTEAYKAWKAGRVRDAFAALMPMKILQDANRAYNIATEGLRTPAGEPVIPANEFNVAEVVARGLGFRTREEADLADKRTARFNYNEWAGKRKAQLYALYWEEGKRERAIGAIKEFNEKNPAIRIKMSDIFKSKKARMKDVRELTEGRTRNPDLRERTDF